METTDLKQGKIYFISFGGSTQLIGRFKEQNSTSLFFFDHLHYWNGYEKFHSSESINYCVTSGIDEIREATQSEKHSLFRFELEHNCI